MAGGKLFALIDDIATILDDVSVMTKVAAKKTAGVLGDDLALNAQQVTGVHADRELPVVWAVARGSLVNKAIIVPIALLITVVAPWAVTPLLMIGGAFLCFEGVEKLAHKLLHPKEEEAEKSAHVAAVADESVDLVAVEKEKIKGAVRTDFILSAEIIVISLNTVADAPFGKRVAVLVAISLLMTIGVYGLVAGIVKLDDGGLKLLQKQGSDVWSKLLRSLGRGILTAAPYMMKGLSIAGTAAMFLVGGGILVHGTPGSHDVLHHWTEAAGAAGSVVEPLVNAIVGVLAGIVCVVVVTGISKLVKKTKKP